MQNDYEPPRKDEKITEAVPQNVTINLLTTSLRLSMLSARWVTKALLIRRVDKNGIID